MRGFLTLAAGVIAIAFTALAFHVFPVDMTHSASLLWIPLFGGAVFVNTFGVAAIVMMVPWEIATDYLERRRRSRTSIATPYLEAFRKGVTTSTSPKASAIS